MQLIKIKYLFGRLGSHNWRYISTLNRHGSPANVIGDGRYLTTDFKGITRRNGLQYQTPASHLLKLPRSFSSEVYATKSNEAGFQSESQSTGVQSESKEQSQRKGAESPTLYCGGLAPGTTYEHLHDVFPAAKTIDFPGKGHAFVVFETEQEVDGWVRAGRVTINDQVVSVNYTNKKLKQMRNYPRLKCLGVPALTTRKDLYDVFPTAKSVYLSPKNKNHKRHAFVTMETQAEVDKWVQSRQVIVHDEPVYLNDARENLPTAPKLPLDTLNNLKVYCRGLAPSTTRDDLLDVFPLAKSIYLSAINENDTRHAYILFDTEADVDDWVKVKGQVTVNGQSVRLCYTGAKAALPVTAGFPMLCRGFDASTTVEDLKEVFPTAQNIHIPHDQRDPQQRHAYILFKTEAEVDEWVKVDGQVTVKDRVVDLNYVGIKSLSKYRSDGARTLRCIGLDKATTVEDLRHVFASALHIHIPRTQPDNGNYRQAYIRFETEAEVDEWVTVKGQVTCNDRALKLAYYGEKLEAYLREKEQRTLKCRGLDISTTVEDLRHVFPSAQEIRIPNRQPGNEKNRLAYVEFLSEEEVDDWVTVKGQVEVNGRLLDLSNVGQVILEEHDARSKILCRGFDASTTLEDLKAVFPTARDILIPKKQQNPDQWHAYVTFDSVAEAYNWVKVKGQVEVNGRVLNLSPIITNRMTTQQRTRPALWPQDEFRVRMRKMLRDFPQNGAVQDFMQEVIDNLENMDMTVAESEEHIMWFKNFFDENLHTVEEDTLDTILEQLRESL